MSNYKLSILRESWDDAKILALKFKFDIFSGSLYCLINELLFKRYPNILYLN